ncbi:MAG: replication initiator protein [Microviridae sp.]|nr:MAG: replication initiator protein [Microviridae sp.]
MPCYRPLTAFKPLEGGSVVFHEIKGCREIKLPCGQCIGCRISKRDAWAFRCYAESKFHAENSFVTLTYDDENLPSDCGLHYSHIQLFHKRLRQRLGSFRFFVCGEYGDDTKRPHYHGLYFGLSFPDAVKCNSLYSQSDIYTSEILSKLWGKGFCSIGAVTFESARYCAVYTTKKVNGDLAEARYSRVIAETGEIVQVAPEFGRMSLKPGIGYDWLVKYAPEVLTHGGVFIGNRKQAVPRYYMDKLALLSEDEFNALKLRLESQVDYDNNTRTRLEVRERVAHGKSRFNAERINRNAL